MSKNTETAVAIIQPSDFKAVAILGEQPGALAELLHENVGEDISAFDLPRNKVPGGGGTFWEVQTADGPKSESFMDGIIVAVKKGKSYWKVAYDDATEMTPPDCNSEDMITGIGDPGGECRTCPLNDFKTATKGDGKACGDKCDIYIITKTGIVPNAIQIPPTSLKNLKQYGIMLMDSGSRLEDVVTRFSLTTEMKQGKKTAIVNFASCGRVPDEMKSFVKAYMRDVKDLILSTTAKRDPELVGESSVNTAEAVATDGAVPFS